MHDNSKRSGKKRLRFRDWLLDQLDTKEIEGVQWIDRERGLFKIPWVHGSHQNWNITDAEIFRQWAIYSGTYKPSRDVADPRKWKTNFRCTLNALPDFEEVRNEGSSRGPRRFKIYSLKSTGKAKKEQSGFKKKEQTVAFDYNLTDREIVQLVDEMMTPGPIMRPALQKPLLISRARPNATFPAFETLVLDKLTGMFPFPHTPWFLAAWNAMAVDQHVEKPELEPFADKSEDESGSEDTAEEDEEHGDQEIIDLIDQMAADSDGPSPEELDDTETSNEKEDEKPSDQEIIDLIDQMAADSDGPSPEELDDTETSNEKGDEEPSDQEIIDLIDQMAADSDGPSPEELDDTETSNEKGDEEPSDQEIIDLVDQMSDFSSAEVDDTEESNEKEFSEDAINPTEKSSLKAGLEDRGFS